MLPFLQLQLAYAALSLALTAGVAWAAQRLAPGAHPLTRAWLTFGGVSAIALLLYLALAAAENPIASLFIVVALLFYSGGIWIPAFLLVGASRAEGRGTRARPVSFALALAVPAVSLHALFVEPNRLQVREETVPFESWPSGSPAVLLAHLSDLQTVGACDRERKAVEEVRRLAPDLIVITGDYVAGPFFDTRPAEEAARAFLAAMRAIAPTVVVAGHSEGEDVRQRVFDGLDLTYLEDAARDFDFGAGRKLRVAGLDPFKPDLRLPREKRPPGTALVVATHDADVTERLEGSGTDLHLAGHTHGGQIALPWFGPPITLTELPRKYARGLFRMGDHWLNVCAGLGMEGNHAPRIRFNCPPEICLLRLEGTGSGPAGTSD
ncbi:MAG: metallophosphoesterase [Planctomycetota bacterium]